MVRREDLVPEENCVRFTSPPFPTPARILSANGGKTRFVTARRVLPRRSIRPQGLPPVNEMPPTAFLRSLRR